MTTILLVRHGETNWNRDGRVQGQSDLPLNETGRTQARTLAEEVADDGIAAVYASDLQRARDTAAIVADRLGLAVETMPGLREKHFGSWEGLTADEVRERYPDAIPGQWGDGETRDEMSARVLDALRCIASRHPGQRVLVVSHGGPLRAVQRELGRADDQPLVNCHRLRVAVEDDRFRGLDG